MELAPGLAPLTEPVPGVAAGFAFAAVKGPEVKASSRFLVSSPLVFCFLTSLLLQVHSLHHEDSWRLTLWESRSLKLLQSRLKGFLRLRLQLHVFLRPLSSPKGQNMHGRFFAAACFQLFLAHKVFLGLQLCLVWPGAAAGR